MNTESIPPKLTQRKNEMINMDIMAEFEYARFKVMEDTFDALVAVVGHTEEIGIYDTRAGMKAFRRLQKLKINYGSIKDFADYLRNMTRYFKNAENAELIRNISKRLNNFAESYRMLL